MNNTIRLIKPTTELEREYLDFYQEWKDSGEEMIPWVIEKDPTDFQEMVQFLQNNELGFNLPEGWVRDSTYWLVNEKNKILGVVNIRHELTERLLKCGGHIGYGIRPSERRKGYATLLLAESLKVTRDLGISRTLVVCDVDNTASARTILKNGGVEDASFTEEDGNVMRRFWFER